ncbi:MAG: hypothetical protein WBA16_05435 [Nonlabens sp.]
MKEFFLLPAFIVLLLRPVEEKLPSVIDDDYNTYCSCIDMGVINQNQVDQYDYIATIAVTSVASHDNNLVISATVKQTFKGESVDIISLTTPADGASCGLSFRNGEEWLLYAYGDLDHLSSGLCTRSVRYGIDNTIYKQRLKQDLAFLKNM